MRTREIAEDLGWFILIVLLLPLAIPVAALALMFLLASEPMQRIENAGALASPGETRQGRR